jgi:hypothetical protein
MENYEGKYFVLNDGKTPAIQGSMVKFKNAKNKIHVINRKVDSGLYFSKLAFLQISCTRKEIPNQPK